MVNGVRLDASVWLCGSLAGVSDSVVLEGDFLRLTPSRAIEIDGSDAVASSGYERFGNRGIRVCVGVTDSGVSAWCLGSSLVQPLVGVCFAYCIKSCTYVVNL